MSRKRLPTGLKLIKGTARKSRMNPSEPAPPPGMPEPPEHLSDRARAVWGGITGLLQQMRVLSGADGFALEGLCESYAELVSAREALAQRGATTYEGLGAKTGRIWRPYPEIRQIADADRRFRCWLAVFGLSPADRGRVSAAADDKRGNPFEEFRR